MFEELGGFFGWLLVIAFGGTIMNYCLKFVNKRYGKSISENPYGKKIIYGSLHIVLFQYC